MLTVAELMTAPTADDTFDSMITWLVAQGLPADKWRAGGVARSLLYVVALTFASVALILANFAAGAYLPTAAGDWLTNLALYVYGVTRPPATFATGSVLAANSSGGIYTYNPGEFIVLTNPEAENPGKAFINTTLFTLNPGDSNIPVAIVARELGSTSNAAAGDITVMGIGDTGVSVTNPAAVLGQDAMTDELLRALCVARLGALSLAGPRGAYVYAIQVALNAGVPVNVNRYSISPSSSTGIVTIYVASPTGPVSSGDLTAILASIEAIARPDSVTVNLASAGTIADTSTITVYCKARAGLDATTLGNAIKAALDSFVAGYDIGGIAKPPSSTGYLYAEKLEAVATAVDPGIYAVDIDGGDLMIPTGYVATVGITVNVRLVTTPTTS